MTTAALIVPTIDADVVHSAVAQVRAVKAPFRTASVAGLLLLVGTSMALVGLTIYNFGFRQVIHWWLAFTLGALSILRRSSQLHSFQHHTVLEDRSYHSVLQKYRLLHQSLIWFSEQ